MKKLAVATGTLVALLLLFEAGLRLAGYDPLGDFDGDRERMAVLRPSENEVLRYELQPGTRGFVWEAAVSVNALGFRDGEYERDKPAGVRRILGFGDSVTFGIGLPIEDTWPKQLERLARATDPNIEVLNLGITGYDSLQEIELVEVCGLPLSPDEVVVAHHLNDLGRVSPASRLVERITARESAWKRLRAVQFVTSRLDTIAMRRLEQNSFREAVFLEENEAHIASVAGDAEVLGLMEKLAQTIGPEPLDYAHRYLRWYTSEARVGRLRHCWERLARHSAQHGFGVTVALVPWLDDEGYAEAYDLAYSIAAHEARRAGFAVVAPVEIFRAAGLSRLRLGGKDRAHPSRAGHRILAQELALELGIDVPDEYRLRPEGDPHGLQDR